MTKKKLIRRKAALARFSVRPMNPANDTADGYEQYVQRKAVEKAALERG